MVAGAMGLFASLLLLLLPGAAAATTCGSSCADYLCGHQHQFVESWAVGEGVVVRAADEHGEFGIERTSVAGPLAAAVEAGGVEHSASFDWIADRPEVGDRVIFFFESHEGRVFVAGYALPVDDGDRVVCPVDGRTMDRAAALRLAARSDCQEAASDAGWDDDCGVGCMGCASGGGAEGSLAAVGLLAAWGLRRRARTHAGMAG